MDFLKKKRDFVDLIIKHIGTSAIMDLLLRLLTCIEPPQPRQDVLNVSRIRTPALARAATSEPPGLLGAGRDSRGLGEEGCLGNAAGWDFQGGGQGGEGRRFQGRKRLRSCRVLQGSCSRCAHLEGPVVFLCERSFTPCWFGFQWEWGSGMG